MGDRPWLQQLQPHDQQASCSVTAGMMMQASATSSSIHGNNIIRKDPGGGYDMAELDHIFLYLNSQDQASAAIQEQPQTLNIFPSQPMHAGEPSPKGSSMAAINSAPSNNALAIAAGSSKRPAAAAAGGQPSRLNNPADQPSASGKDGKAAVVKKEGGGGGGKQHTSATASEHEGPKTPDAKTLRRLAQNREAARKSRLRKKAYIQNLETSRIRLSQLEQELVQRSRTQGCNIGWWSLSCRHWRTKPRGGVVRRRVRAVGGEPREDDGSPAGGGGGGAAAAARRRGGGGCGGGGAAAAAGGRGGGAPRRAGGAQGRRGQRRRLPPRLRDVAARRRALLPLDRWLPPIRAHQDGGAARGAADGAAGGGSVRRAAVGEGEGGGARPRPPRHLPRPLRRRLLRCAPALPSRRRRRRRRRRLLRCRHGPPLPGHRQPHLPRSLRQAGGRAEAADAVQAAADTDGEAVGAVLPRHRRPLPPPPRPHLPLALPATPPRPTHPAAAAAAAARRRPAPPMKQQTLENRPDWPWRSNGQHQLISLLHYYCSLHTDRNTLVSVSEVSEYMHRDDRSIRPLLL